MRILGIESAGKVASVALTEDGKVLCDFTINGKYTHSKTIMPMLESMRDIMDVDLSEVDAIGVSSGPGSYTGLRIGASTAKALAHAWQKPIVGVSTIESMAHNVGEKGKLICPMLDARRQHAFCGAYRYEGDTLVNVIAIDLRSVEDFAKEIKAMDQEAVFLGDGLANHYALVEKFMDDHPWQSARAEESLPKASTLALIAEAKLMAGESETYMTHQPDYYRPSQAERELGSK